MEVYGEPTVTLDGKASGEYRYGGCDDETYFYYCTERVTAVAGEIPDVSITFTEPVIGAAPVDATVPADAKYSVVSTVWYDSETEEPMSGNFADDGKYTVVVTVMPADGWMIPNNAEVFVNSKRVNNWDVNSDGNLRISMQYHFCEELTNASITYTAPEVTVPTDANYQITNVTWVDLTDDSALGEDKHSMLRQRIAR